MAGSDFTIETQQLILGAAGRSRYRLSEVAQSVGLSEGEVAEIWTALGRVAQASQSVHFSELDLRLIRSVADLARFLGDDRVPPALVRTVRSAARSLRRISDAHVTGLLEALGDRQPTAEELVDLIGRTDPVMEDVISGLWGHAVNQAVASALSGVDDPRSPEIATGFVDLAGYTARAQQLQSDQLFELVDRFDAVSNEVMAIYGASLVKTIGDEVMFTHQDGATAVRVALTLVERCESDPLLLSARAGLAFGRPLRIAGDFYGPSVNLAARLVELARPGSVLVDEVTASLIEGEQDLDLAHMRSQKLRGLGSRRAFVARSAAESPAGQH